MQDAIAHVSEEITAVVGSSTNLRQMFRRKRKAIDNNLPTPGTVGELLIPDQVKDYGNVAEWLRRSVSNHATSTRVGSNPRHGNH